MIVNESTTMPMDKQTHQQILWRKLICVAAILFVLAAPTLGRVCSPGDCLLQNSKSAKECSAMDMPECITLITPSHAECYGSRQSLGVPIAQNGNDVVQLASAVPTMRTGGLPTSQRIRLRADDGPPTQNVQSLFSVLLL